MPDSEGRPPPGSDPDARRTASQISCNRRSEGGLSLLVNRVSRRVARPTLDGAKSASPRCRMLTGAGRCLCHRRRQSGSVRLPRKLFLNPAPLGCHHLISMDHLSLTLILFVCVSAQVMYGASVISGHFGDVVLWELSPPAAGEVLIRSEPELPERPSALLCGSWALMRAFGTVLIDAIMNNTHNNILPTHTAAPAQI